jgi:tRNA nucleotidyltransferase (CCA-adding enzyme)
MILITVFVVDQLLGKHCVDVDIALDGMHGVEFANKVRDYLIAHDMEAHRVGTIKANPEQSKHLETATTIVLGYQIDFSHLRSETYTEKSRIPQIVCIKSNPIRWNP